ncbi:MAG TPA: 50S ribosomal protein L29 [Kiritimatiellia bacterium]|jgi:large subunit ribosomal protein L29|nr:50S ribosomal protein L29 [Kiritimatiellia bacterium]HNR93194.1 50S ribosomal protein L29 [Kiritimatiellia bacterium]HNS81162.1 50S ribosomal protein L29 [Kiritimatiellia bacterium]HPA77601.1 50S ribosomal protein L29 [Kiritimatiellia bacterium]HQQ03639.1 50S ribosomal protein L29 [Kiritimatiellia bacterium]
MKASEIRELTGEELAQRIDDARKELFNLRLQQTGGQLEKPSRIREVRRDIARMSTEARHRQKVSR